MSSSIGMLYAKFRRSQQGLETFDCVPARDIPEVALGMEMLDIESKSIADAVAKIIVAGEWVTGASFGDLVAGDFNESPKETLQKADPRCIAGLRKAVDELRKMLEAKGG